MWELTYKKAQEMIIQNSGCICIGYIVLADIFDYLVAPIFGVPVLGDIFHVNRDWFVVFDS